MEGRHSAEAERARTAIPGRAKADSARAEPEAVRTDADAVYVRSVVAGSHAALAELYDRHAAAVFGASLRLLGERLQAEEVVQDTFLTLWNRAEQFDSALGSLRAWLLTIARNRAIDRLRSAGRRPAMIHFGALEADAESRDAWADALERHGLVANDDASDPERQAELAALRVSVRGALNALPVTEREALVLAYFEGLTQQEIAARLEWPLGTVKTRTRRALQRLRELLGPLVGPSPERSLAATPGDPDGPR